MSDDFDLIAEIREDQGKGASRRLRHQGKVPAIIYGAGRPPRALAFDHNKVLKQLENESFYSSVLSIKVGEKSQAAILKDMQRHPAKPRIMHMDFQRIVEDQEIKMNVPLHFIGEDDGDGHHKVVRIRVETDGVTLACPEGDTTMRLSKTEAEEGPFFCPRHDVELKKMKSPHAERMLLHRKLHDHDDD